MQLAPNHVLLTGRTELLNKCISTSTSNNARAAHEEPIGLGARLLQPAPDLDSDEGYQVYADPAGHPFCIGWGHPSREALAVFVADRLGRRNLDQDT